MIDSISGVLRAKDSGRATVEVGGVGFGVFVSGRTERALPPLGEKTSLFSYLYVRENSIELYGFLSHEELALFISLISVSGVGPKSALSILEVGELQNLKAAIKEGRPELLTKAAGIGRKTAERIIVELKTKMDTKSSGARVAEMESDFDIVEALTNFGYRKDDVLSALSRVRAKGLEARLREAMKILGGKGE